MIIIERSLQQLSEQYSICEAYLVDEYSLRIQLGENHYVPKLQEDSVIFGVNPKPTEIFYGMVNSKKNLVLQPGAQVISCSKHIYRIPVEYFGMVQTKGTLARLFVQATCNDGQVEPGFHGYITLEIVNLSPWVVEIPVGSEVAQLYLMKCNSPAEKPYSGRYAEMALTGPTIPIYR